MATREYTSKEEAWNSATHAVGILFATAALAVLVTLASVYGDAWNVVSCAIFGVSMIVAYSASSVYHFVNDPSIKRILKKFDHIAIYYLIAGSYTPFVLVSMRGVFGWTIFGIVWTLALIGTFLKIFLPASGTKFWSIGLYLAMGWMIIFAFWKLVEVMPVSGLVFLALGGLFYTFGVLFYIKKQQMYAHAIWHVFVLLGTIMHFFAVLFSCVFIKGY